LRTYIAEQQRKTLRERLIAGYQTNARADSALAAEWEPIADETWPTYRASTRQSR
jgi:hypothetical protein